MKVKIGKYQNNDRKKVDIHIDKYDSWNASHTMAYVILPILLQLRDTANSIPASFGDIEIFDTNGFNITVNFDKTTVTVTTAFGITNSYNLWIIKAGSETSGDFTFYTL